MIISGARKMKALIAAFLFALLLMGCEENSPTNLEVGSYSGDFTVFYDYNSPEQSSRTGSTILTLDENGYNLTENTSYTPPRSEGKCSWGAIAISFQDTTAHTLEFDHRLIIGGAYNYSFDGTTLDMSQIDSDLNRKYRYILTKD